jgi:hypothetical protein
MTTPSSTLVRLLLVGLGGFVLVQACGASAYDPADRQQGGSGGVGGLVGATGGSKVFNPDVTVPPVEGGMNGLSALCGINPVDGCTPDDARACSDYVPPSPRALELLPLAGGAGGDGGYAGGGASGASGSAGQKGAGGDGGVGAAGGGGASGAGFSGAGGADQTGTDGGATGTPAYACRVVRTRNASLSECAATGGGQVNAPCFTGADCGAGLGCVMDGAVSRCLPYCCAGEVSCTKGSYCTERTLRDASIPASASAVLVPVCAPAENCELSEPFPCPSERACQCAAGTACMVVRPDGTTACSAPGEGTLGEPCPCAYGFVCSQGTATATCLKLCATAEQGDAGLACPSGKCQASAELPAGWGVCVGG